MKKLTALLVALAFTGLAAPAFAQSQDADTPSELITINPMHLEGDITKTDVFWEKHKDRPEFERLSRLKRSFLSNIEGSAQNNALD